MGKIKDAILRKPSWPLYRKLTALVLGLTGLGVVIVANTTFVWAGQRFGDPYFFLKKDILWAALGCIVFLFTQKIRLENLRRFSRPILLAAIVLLFMVLIFGREINGAKRWLEIGLFSFQPLEFAKIAILIYLAAFLDRKSSKTQNPLLAFMPSGLLIGLIMVLIYLGQDIGTVILLAWVMLILSFTDFKTLKYLCVLPVTVLVLVGIGLAFLHPGNDPTGMGYQVNQSLLCIKNGGLFGVGLGQGLSKLFYLPEAHTDFIFASSAEEWGLFGSIFFIALFFFLVYWGVQTAKRSTDRFRSLLATGITALIGVQAILHIGVVVGLFPNKGVPLPFISYGGSSLIFTLFAAGLLVNIARDLPPGGLQVMIPVRNSSNHTLKP